MNDLVSIIIPSFNYGHVLPQTLANLEKQTYRNWEALIIDDGSTDETAAVAAKFTATDSRFRYCYQQNQGLSAARNTGLRLAQGHYLQFLDADDLLSPEKLALQVEFMLANPENDICYTRCYYFRDGDPGRLFPDLEMQGKEWMPRTSGQGNVITEALLLRNIMPVNAALLRKRVMEKAGTFRTEMKSLEDWDYWLRCALEGCTFYYLDHPRAYAMVRVHGGSMTQNVFKMRFYELRMRKDIEKRIAADKHLTQLNRRKQKGLCKDLFRNWSLGTDQRGRTLLRLLGWKKFLRHYLGALNHRRKRRRMHFPY